MMFELSRFRRSALATAVMLGAVSVNADEMRATQTAYGGVGLLQMPTARMAPYGEFSGTYYDSEEYRRMSVSMQLFPWLEANIRYVDIRPITYSEDPSFSGDQTGKDKGIDIKVRLLEESYYLPEVSLGWRDLAGTGVFASEYLVASKRYGDFDFSVGLGWGYMGSSENIDNPFCELRDSFCTRDNEFLGNGGKFEIDKWFRGPTSLFGGIQYAAPIDGLTLKAEYDGNDYRTEEFIGNLQADSRWNFGAEYQLADNLSLKLSYERGNTWMFGFTVRTNFTSLGQVKVDRSVPARGSDKAVEPLTSLTDPQELQRLARELNRYGGLNVREMQFFKRNADSETEDTARIYGYQSYFRDNTFAIENTTRTLTSALPESITQYEIVESIDDMQMATDVVDVEKALDAIERRDINTKFDDAITRVDIPLSERDKVGAYEREIQITRPRVSVKPFLRQAFGNPENFYMYQLGLDLTSDWWIAPNTFIHGTLSGNLMTNFDDFNFLVDGFESPLPRVRTYIREYVTFSDIWMERLQLSHMDQPATNLYTAYYAGYMERMFGGVGTELLYRELDANWAIGVDMNWVKQRDYESHTGFLDYDVFTGHITGYWEPNFMPNSLFKVAAGQFLAGDRGIQINFEHKFRSGMIIGAYAAKTNVSSADYGEGSFTKGFYISIPIDLLQMQHSRNRGVIGWTPLTRDGGQMLSRSIQLYNTTDRRSPFYTD
ncbi:MAG TPA: YjbH domain-containing protein [Pseudidiomarina sp.]|nr:YjbH domain-containing protein [Pseudidiomarina sp.]